MLPRLRRCLAFVVSANNGTHTRKAMGFTDMGIHAPATIGLLKGFTLFERSVIRFSCSGHCSHGASKIYTQGSIIHSPRNKIIISIFIIDF